jgi:hypothetical protein
MNCNQCGSPIESVSGFCTTCGRAAPVAQLKGRRWFILTSIALFLIGCVTPALFFRVARNDGHSLIWQGYDTAYGAQLLFMGLFLGWARMNFAAFANLPLLLSWIFLARGRRKAARNTSLLALLLSLQTLELLVMPFLWDEAGTREGYLMAPHIGCLCWLASMVIILVAAQRVLNATNLKLQPPQLER